MFTELTIPVLEVLAPFIPGPHPPAPSLPQVFNITGTWNPELTKSLEDSDLPIFPMFLACDIYQYAYVESILQALLPITQRGTILFIPNSPPLLPEDITSHFRIFTTSPKQIEVFVLPYWFDRITEYKNDFGDVTGKVEDKVRTPGYQFSGFLGSSACRLQMWNDLRTGSGMMNGLVWDELTMFPATEWEESGVGKKMWMFESLRWDSRRTDSWAVSISSYHPIPQTHYVCHSLSGTAWTDSKQGLENQFVKMMKGFTHALCPVGDNNGSRRLIEAIAYGAVPVLFGDPQMLSVPACCRGIVADGFGSLGSCCPAMFDNLLHWSKTVDYIKWELAHRMGGA